MKIKLLLICIILVSITISCERENLSEIEPSSQEDTLNFMHNRSSNNENSEVISSYIDALTDSFITFKNLSTENLHFLQEVLNSEEIPYEDKLNILSSRSEIQQYLFATNNLNIILSSNFEYLISSNDEILLALQQPDRPPLINVDDLFDYANCINRISYECIIDPICATQHDLNCSL